MKPQNTIPLNAALLAALLSAGAGIYLLTQHTADPTFDPLLHGIGLFFIACGFFMGWYGSQKVQELELLRRIEDATRRPPSAEDTPE